MASVGVVLPPPFVSTHRAHRFRCVAVRGAGRAAGRVAVVAAAGRGGLLVVLSLAIALFFRDPDRSPPADRDAVLAPADGAVTHAGAARDGEAPPGDWKQVTIF